MSVTAAVVAHRLRKSRNEAILGAWKAEEKRSAERLAKRDPEGAARLVP